MQAQVEKFKLIKLGIEEIPEYIRSLQEQTGQDVETISFHQTELIDVVTPVEIVFRRRGEKSRADALIDLARKMDMLTEAVTLAATHLQATPRSPE
ncbi:MAG TPA: hypothetical protein DEB39_14545 [Planctomycetaceae bacterium]|nr:hypothetical protein [Planctomycetaceae bacterium]